MQHLYIKIKPERMTKMELVRFRKEVEVESVLQDMFLLLTITLFLNKSPLLK